MPSVPYHHQLGNEPRKTKKIRGHSAFLVCNEIQEAKASNKLADQFGQREPSTPELHIKFDRRIDLSQSHGDTEMHENEIDHFSVSQCLSEKPI